MPDYKERRPKLKNEQPLPHRAVDIPGILPYEFGDELTAPEDAYRGTQPTPSPHGPQNAEHELRKAYCDLIEAELVQQQVKTPHSTTLSEQFLDELRHIYKHAFRKYRDHHLVSAERWAHAAKHLARTLFLESKIAYLEKRPTDLPYLNGATSEDYDLAHQKSDTVLDLLDSVAGHIPPGLSTMPDLMERCLKRAHEHLHIINNPDYHHELLRAARIKAAYHYGRALEVMALAYGADFEHKAA